MKAGFEAEFHANVNPLIAHLARQGYAGMSEMHSYHCDCASCAFHNGYAFRAQTDSSCGGEVISDVMTTPEQLADWTVALQSAAVEVDAEPALSAGFHAHVSLNDLGTELRLYRALTEFILWEPALTVLSAGRWTLNRGNNRALRHIHGHHFVERNLIRFNHDEDVALVRDLDRGELAVLYENHYDEDRHSNLNIRTRHDTWEFRMWNSTRSAWRMQLFVGVSAAFVSFDVLQKLRRTDISLVAGSESRNLTLLRDVLDSVPKFTTTAALVDRQLSYLRERAGTGHVLAFTQ